MKLLYTLFLALLIGTMAYAQDGYKIGAKVGDFTLKDSKNQATSLSQYKDAQVIVVVFTSMNCPYARLYDGRLQALASAYGSKGVQFIYINPAIGLEEGGDTIKAMAGSVDTSTSPLPYLLDSQLQVSKQFGAVKTPEVFVLQRGADGYYLRYKGAIDDNPQAEAYAKDKFLKNTLDHLLAGRNAGVYEKRPTGCMIKRF